LRKEGYHTGVLVTCIVVPTLAGGAIALGIVVGCIIVYCANVSYHKKHGLDIELAFREIPPV
jgi:hypothetical protein